ncbi:MAG: hypothetical protein ACFFDF_12325 [Candidatus Odinarchaeota archaeon]
MTIVGEETNKCILPFSEGFKVSNDNYFYSSNNIDSILSSFIPERRARAERQITILLKKMGLHSQFKEYCISSIKKLIKIEIKLAQKKDKFRKKVGRDE